MPAAARCRLHGLKQVLAVAAAAVVATERQVDAGVLEIK
jgi:hypothetical protein